MEKKLRVMVDWTIDIFFNRDVTRLKMFASEREEKKEKEGKLNIEEQSDKTAKKEIIQ
jgi:hypothetical protein